MSIMGYHAQTINNILRENLNSIITLADCPLVWGACADESGTNFESIIL